MVETVGTGERERIYARPGWHLLAEQVINNVRELAARGAEDVVARDASDALLPTPRAVLRAVAASTMVYDGAAVRRSMRRAFGGAPTYQSSSP